jgi:hypothetical protein
MRKIQSFNFISVISVCAATLLLVPAAIAFAPSAPKPVEVVVYKDPDCGCCKAWVSHLEKNGFHVTTHDTRDMASVKQGIGVPPALQSCHTALVNGYVIEGHVSASDIRRLLASKPKIAGLAVPGMPAGSPGMEGMTKQSYDVIAFEKNGKANVFAKH